MFSCTRLNPAFFWQSAALTLALCCLSINAAQAEQGVLIEDELVSVTSDDVINYFSEIGMGGRQDKMASADNIRVAIESLYTSRFIAASAGDRSVFNPALEAWVGRETAIRELAIKEIDREVEQRLRGADFEAAAREYYVSNKEQFQQGEQVRASHVLLTIADDQRLLDVMLAADKVRDLALSGEDFASLSETYSTVKPSTPGGDLGFFGRREMVPEFEEVAFSLEPGEVSDLVISRFGVHVIKVFERKPATTAAFEAVEAQIIEKLEIELRGRFRSDVLLEVSKRARLNRTSDYDRLAEELLASAAK